ncbi:hypothetical protein [Sphaerotilus hippei]|uniref:hypothetical protein n=1 Tax=Sphaerotilus hippei TaxID=744406 RepID=UPI0014741E6F|nr:hypothetical protein [Sphaerotilus hippei]
MTTTPFFIIDHAPSRRLIFCNDLMTVAFGKNSNTIRNIPNACRQFRSEFSAHADSHPGLGA